MKLSELSNAVIEHALDGQVHSQVQEREMYDPSPEIDSGVEHVLAAARLLPAGSEARAHLLTALQHFGRALKENAAERKCWHQVTERAASRSWTVQRVANETRPLLADLLQPFTGEARKADRLAALHAIFESCPAKTLRSVSLAHELDNRRVAPRKTTLLWQLLAEWEAGRAPK